MLHDEIIKLGLEIPIFWLAQAPVETEINTAEDAALVFSGPQFFTALIAGVVLAFAFQLLFTNLGIAAGISLAGGSGGNSDRSDRRNGNGDMGGTIRKIGLAVGLGTLISVSITLFLASLFAVKLSLFVSPVSGAIVGLVIWGTYFTLLVWVSSTTVGSLIGSVVNTATAGFQALVGTATAAIGGSVVSKQVVATAEAAAAAVRREIIPLDPVTFRENVEDYLQALKPPELDWNKIRSDFENLLNDPNLQDVVSSDNLRNIDRQTFVDLISSRSDLSKKEVNRLADQLEGVWNKTTQKLPQKNNVSDFVDYLKSAPREQLLGKDLSQKIDTVLGQLGQGRQGQNQGLGQAMTLGFNSLLGLVLGRADLSELDVEKVTNQLQKLKGSLGEKTKKVTAQLSDDKNYSPIRADLENFLLNAYPWQLKPENLRRELRNLLYDPQADPSAVRYELEQIRRADFVNWLQQKGILTQAKINQTADILEDIRQEILAVAEEAQERENTIALLADVENYLLNTPRENLTPEKIQLNFKPILEDSGVDYEQLSRRLNGLNRAYFERILEQRNDLLLDDKATIITELESNKNRVLQEAQDTQAAVKAKAEEQWLKVQSYLRDTGKDELNPDAIAREVKLLLDDPQAGISALRARGSRFDRDTLVQLLSQRRDLSEEQVNQTIDQVEGIWTEIRYAPENIAGKVQQQYDNATTVVTDYLRNTGKDELNPEGIQRDLSKLLEDPQVGLRRIQRRVGAMDRDTLVKLLSQREDLSEEQANEVIDSVLDTVNSVKKAPRRLARRTQEQVQNFQSSVTDYLRSTDREELNPEGIKRDIQLLLNDPRAGAENLKERLAYFDRDTLVSLLSQREDISEEDVNRIIDQILVVREQVMEQLQKLQYQLQSAVDNLLNKIRDYLNGLERPELNYEGIQSDVRKLFDDPEAGFDALRDRLSQFDRNTLVAVLSSREDISETDANRIIDQVERTRVRVLQRAERIQHEALRRLDDVKLQAQQQLEETRKAAATAAWWLFFTALVSAIAAAVGGVVGVTA